MRGMLTKNNSCLSKIPHPRRERSLLSILRFCGIVVDREDQIRNYKLLLTEIAFIQISSASRGIVHNIHKRSEVRRIYKLRACMTSAKRGEGEKNVKNLHFFLAPPPSPPQPFRCLSRMLRTKLVITKAKREIVHVKSKQNLGLVKLSDNMTYVNIHAVYYLNLLRRSLMTARLRLDGFHSLNQLWSLPFLNL